MQKISVIVGSLRKESFNKKLMLALDKLNHPKLTFDIVDVSAIPLFNQDEENPLPAVVSEFKKRVEQSDGVLFVTPEYNRSIPGVLKNIIDWGTRPYGKNAWANKRTGIIGTSQSAVGTAVAQSHLRSIIVAEGAIVMGLPEVYLVYKEGLINDKHEITNADTKKFLQGFLDTFSEFVSA